MYLCTHIDSGVLVGSHRHELGTTSIKNIETLTKDSTVGSLFEIQHELFKQEYKDMTVLFGRVTRYGSANPGFWIAGYNDTHIAMDVFMGGLHFTTGPREAAQKGLYFAVNDVELFEVKED